MQAAAELQIAARVEDVTQADVRAALWERRELVKAWTLRGTLHLHPADELPLWFAARRALSPDGGALDEWRDPHGALHPPLSAEDVDEVGSAVREVLDGRCLLREEIVERVSGRVPPAAVDRLRSGFAFFLGTLCQGPPQGSRITLARADQWVEGWREVDEQEALTEARRRFLATYGPARPVDFGRWFGEASFGDLGVEAVDVDGHRAFVLEGDTDFPAPHPSVRLVPEYDVYVMGFRERDHLVPEAVRGQVAAHGRGRYEGPAGVRFLLVDGVAAGLWERKKRAKRIELTVTPAVKLTRAQQTALDAEADRIGRFYGLEPVLSFE